MSRDLGVAQSPAQSNPGCFQGLGSTTSLGNPCHCLTTLIVQKNPKIPVQLLLVHPQMRELVLVSLEKDST